MENNPGWSSEESESVFSEEDEEVVSIVEARRDETHEVRKLAEKESRNIQFWRLLVVAMILVTGGLVAAGTYHFLSRNQNEDYKTSYEQFVNTIQIATVSHAESIAQAYSSMSDVITAEAAATNQSFPYVTIPAFEVLGEHLRIQSDTEIFFFAPLVENITEWEAYSVKNQRWINESRRVALGGNGTITNSEYINEDIVPFVWHVGNFTYAPTEIPPCLPTWQLSPPPFSPAKTINYDGYLQLKDIYNEVSSIKEPVFGFADPFFQGLSGTAVSPEDHDVFHAQVVDQANKSASYYSNPHSGYIQPVFRHLQDDEVVGLLVGVLAWDRYMANLLPKGVSGFYAILQNTCNQTFSYVLKGSTALYLGEGDFHDAAYDEMRRVIPFSKAMDTNVSGLCSYSLVIYPSDEFKSTYHSNLPAVFTVVAGIVFFMMAVTFFVYDGFVQRRNTKVVGAAARSNEIVSSLFPSTVRDRLFEQKDEDQKLLPGNDANNPFVRGATDAMDETDGDLFKGKPIADLFPEATVLFADIVGFTAWSSMREPTQVFTLLETLYRAFDEIAKRRHVFKIETIGDCYVAVTGLPDVRKDHALLMARFARECMVRMHDLTKKLEVILGPDTSDLSLRVGIHSGPVTAGVLRGERSRFQLFGDTMNTASRMESTSEPGCIQISQETADMLNFHGKVGWYSARKEKVIAKGKGELQTYWLHVRSNRDGTNSVSNVSSTEDKDENLHSSDHMLGTAEAQSATPLMQEKTHRLIDWNVEVLTRILKQIIARRGAIQGKHKSGGSLGKLNVPSEGTVLDEVKEIITLPSFDAAVVARQEDSEKMELDPVVDSQLREYVSNIAAMYRNNPFHGFEHASHVAMSVVKLLSRVVAPTDHQTLEDVIHSKEREKVACSLHDHTYGITSDPLTQFACVFSALIHDVDHPGVPNQQTIKENSKLAVYYKGKSIAEQNSVDLSWTLLMDSQFTDLYQTICASPEEQQRFRQLVVNSVMATDIVDKELKALRNLRWERAFSEEPMDPSAKDNVDRKATIVIEHIIQASDVAHTMQHWHIYRKWNELFFQECYLAFRNGRGERNPAEVWYDGEIGFFDFYIIPLAKKLKSCGVFGVSSDEYLNYALKNRDEWKDRGKVLVEEMLERAKALYG